MAIDETVPQKTVRWAIDRQMIGVKVINSNGDERFFEMSPRDRQGFIDAVGLGKTQVEQFLINKGYLPGVRV